jgi:penicillin G amidase
MILSSIQQLLRSATRAAWRATRPCHVSLRLECLTAPAEVLYDEAGVPYLFASSARDLLALQGYVHAGHRLFQMELMRRLARGQLSELLGRRPISLATSPVYLEGFTTVDLDTLMRGVAIEEAAERSREQATPEFRALMASYAEGVNEHLRRGRRELELLLLRSTPEPWSERDPFLLYKAFAFELCVSWVSKLTLHALFAGFPGRAAALRELICAGARTSDAAVRFDAAAAQRLAELGKAAVAFAGASAGAPGSNAWAVEGSRTTSALPLLCNDPHLPLHAPSLLYLQHLEAPGVKVAGLGGPGIPGVAMGHNASYAWGVTHAYVDDCDLFAEQLSGDRCATPDGAVELQRREVHIAVRGEEVERRDLRVGPHGLLLSDLLTRPPDQPAAFALRWTGSDGGRDLEGLWQIASGATWSDFRQGCALIATPAWNMVYADRAGHVGYTLAGWVPRRPWGGSLDIVDGARWGDWQGFLPAEELPHVLDPEDGIVASANNRVIDEAYPYYISDLFQLPLRVRRIRALLGDGKLDVDAMRRMQLDDFSDWAFRLNRDRLQPLLTANAVRDADALLALRVLSSWDGRLRVEYVAPSVFHSFLLAFARRVLAAQLGTPLSELLLARFEIPAFSLERMIAGNPEAWLGGAPDEPIAATIEAALADGVRWLRGRLGVDPRGWGWGRLHTLTHRHLLDAEDGGPTRWLSIGPAPSPGDWGTLALGAFRLSAPFANVLGPDGRLIVDLSDLDASRWVLSTGQSGHPLSPRYRDQAALMAAGADRAWPFSRGAIEAAAVQRLSLQPAG